MLKTLLISFTAIALVSPAFAEGDAAKGEKSFKKCKACHMIADGDNIIFKGGKTGPNLYDVLGRTAGTVEGFRYGDDIVAAGTAGLVWDTDNLVSYLANPKGFLQETLDDSGAKSKMSFKLAKGGEDIVAYLGSVAPAQ
ncbi:MAG: cytochrome C [Pseudoruegeria sp.]